MTTTAIPTEKARTAINAESALRGSTPYTIAGRAVRRIGLDSVCYLERLGSPFAEQFSAAMLGRTAPAPSYTFTDLLVFVWLHAAPWEDVKAACLRCAPGYNAPAFEAATEWAADWDVAAAMEDIVRCVVSEATAVRAAAFDARSPYESGTKKNTSAHANSPHTSATRDFSAAVAT